MKYTLLELTQNILSRLDSDEVDSISDTVEATQVARVIRNTYFNIISRSNLPEHKKLIQLTASGDNTKPVLMTRPDNVQRIDWIKYNVRSATDTTDRYEYIIILPLAQFLEMTDGLNTSDTANVGTMTFNGITFAYNKKLRPVYCTIVEDDTIIFDSYDSAVESTLQTSKTKCFALTVPTFDLIDTTIPDLDDVQFPLLLNEATAVAFVDLKQQANPKAEQESRRQWISLQRTKMLAKVPTPFDALPHFGRRL
jgi:hypothetical protein